MMIRREVKIPKERSMKTNRNWSAWISAVLVAVCLLSFTHGTAEAGKLKDPRKMKIPPLGEIQTPDIDRHVLDNGMVVYLLEDHDFPLVDLQMTIRAGQIYEPESKRGLASITGDVIRTGGTTSISGDDLDELLESSGAYIESNIGGSSGSVSGSFLSDKAATGLELMADLVFNPAFPEEKIEQAKVGVRTSISSRNDEFVNIAIREFRKLMYGEHSPYGWHPEYETVEAITREDLIAYHGYFFHPDRMILTVAGDFNKADMLRQVEAAFGGYEKASSPLPPMPEVPANPPSGVYYAEKTNVTNSAVLFGLPGHLASDPDYAALEVLNQILGSGFSSRLVNEIRTKKGLAYSVGSAAGSNWDRPGTWICFLLCQGDSTMSAGDAMKEEVRKIVTDPVTEEELQRAKDTILNSLVFSLSSKRAVMNRQAFYEFHGYPKDFLQTYQASVPALTTADLLAAAQRHISPDKMTTIIVGEGEKFDRPVTSLGNVTELDITIPDPPATFEAPPLTAESEAAGREIVSAAFDAHGGNAITNVKTMLKEGAGKRQLMGQEMSYSLVATKIMPDRTFSEVNFGFFAITHCADGNGGWLQTPQGVMDRPAEELAQAAEEEMTDFFYFMTHWNDIKFQALDQEELDGTLCDVVYPHDVLVKEWLLYFDAETHLLKGMVYRTRGAEGPVKSTEIYSDYRDVSGVKLAFANNTLADGEFSANIEFTKIEINVEVDESIFARPE
jgi:zinc protease